MSLDREPRFDALGTLLPDAPRRFLRNPAVRALRGGISPAKLYNDCRAQLWTPPVKIGGGRASGWPSDECTQLMDAYISGLPADEIRSLVRQLVAQRNQPRAS